MSGKNNQPVIIACVFTWLGFVCAISFMEAWLKFQAPGITVPLGLGIGRLVFGALNKVEWVFGIAIYICFISNKQRVLSLSNWQFPLVLTVLMLQTFWLLPALDERATLVIKGEAVAGSSLHFYYIIFEVIKVGVLFVMGIQAFRSSTVSVISARK